MSETKRYGSVEVLCEKILHEAEDYKNELLEKTSSEAKGISEEYEKKAQAAKDEILSRAEEKAAEARRTAESAEETRARNARLSVKSELLAAAYRRAEEKIALLPKEEAIALFLPYLKEALEQKPAGQARLVVGEKSPFGADELCAAAEAPKDILPDGAKKAKGCGFWLETDEITLDCSVHALIEAIRSETEKDVSRLLFAER